MAVCPASHAPLCELMRGLRALSSIVSRATVFDICALQPRYGIGARLYRKSWAANGWDPETHHFIVTRTVLVSSHWPLASLHDASVMPHRQRSRFSCMLQASQKAWGVRCWKGVTDSVERLIPSATKREWAHLPRAPRQPGHNLLSAAEAKGAAKAKGAAGMYPTTDVGSAP